MNFLNIKVILRGLKNNKFYSFIAIFGLAVGMSATILLFIYTQHELSYDCFNSKAKRIYRINSVFKEETTEIWPICIAFSDSAIQKQVPEIEEYLQIYDNSWSGAAELTKDNVRFKNIKLIYSSPNIHRVFDIKYLKGDPNAALLTPFSIVLTRSTAEKLFGTIDILGKNLLTSYSKNIFTVTGVVEDFPSNSHLSFDAIAPIESTPFNIYHGGMEVYTYVLFNDKASIEEGIRKTRDCYNKILVQRISEREEIKKVDSFLQKLTDIHLKSDFQSKNGYNAAYKKVFIYLSMALVVLLIAIINFINLLTVQYEGKAKEIGVQKAIGASRKHIIVSFMSRSVIFSFIALIIAVILVEFLIPSLGSILNRDLISTYRNNVFLIIGLPLLAIIVGLISGAYPALFISRFSPSLAIKGIRNAKGTNRFTKALVVIQFAISIFLVTNLLVMNNQIAFMKNVDLGFNPENVVAIKSLNENVEKSYSSIKSALQKLPEIKSIGASFHLFGAVASGQKIDVLGDAPIKDFLINEYRIFPGFLETLGFRMIEGRPFDESINSDKQAIILNETAVRMLGLSKPLNADINFFGKMHVIGVVKDFHYYTLVDKIEPIMFTYYNSHLRNIVIKVPQEDLQAVLKKIEKIIKEYDSGYVMDYIVIDDFCRNRYGSQEQTETLSTYATILSLALALFGLYAMSMFIVQKRTKEIGIRKVNGATRFQIVKLLLMVYTRQVGVALIIAAPFAYFVLDSWLNNFAYKIKLTPIPFLVAGLMALAVAILTVVSQTWKAAGKNPVESLKYE